VEPLLANRWVVLVLLCFARISMGLQFQSLPPIAPYLIADMEINYAQLGMLIGLFMLPGIFLALPGGLLGARFGDKAVVLIALALLTAGGGLVASSASFGIAFAGRMLGGVGGVVLNTQLPKIITDRFTGREISTAMGSLMSMWPLGIAIALATLGGLARATSWQTAMYATAAYSALALVLVATLYREFPLQTLPSPAGRPSLWTLSNRELGFVVVAGGAWMLLNTGFIVFMSFTPALLIDRGFTVARAGFLVSWASLIAIGSLPLGGYLIDHTRKPNLWIAVGVVATAMACFMLSLAGPVLLWIVLFGLAFAPPTSAIVALPSEVLRPESRSTGFGAFWAVYYLGMAVVPSVAGYLLDATGNAATPVWFSGLLWVMILPVLVVFRVLQHRWPPASASTC